MITSTPMTNKENSPHKDARYEWQPEHATEQIPLRADESWLIYQAQSYLGRETTLQEAKELFMKIDVTTRQPIRTPEVRRSAGFVAALRALFSGGILVLSLSACGPSTDAQGYEPVDTPMVIFKPNSMEKIYVYKMTDDTDNNVCYILSSSTNTELHCMVKFDDPSR